jgi:thiamine biosynthesis lipoprotein
MTVVFATAQLDAQERFEFKEMHMGMEVRIVLYAQDTTLARSAARLAFDKIEELENIMSDYRAESELRRLERRAGEWIPASGALRYVLGVAADVATKTGGAFDPTVAPVVHLWREARRTGRLPTKAAIDSARRLVSWKRIEVDVPRGLIRIAPTTRLDLGGIAKGAILQYVIQTLEGLRMPALVEAGGDLVVSNAPPGEPGWRIAIADSTIVITDAAVSTSGPQHQFAEIDGVRYSHVVDPRTGMALTNDYEATVMHHNATIADALATALTVMGPDGLGLVRRHYPDAVLSVRRVSRSS